MATILASDVGPGATPQPSAADIRLVITASSLGTIFEWYDFFIYGTLAASGIIGRTFFPAENETVQTLLAWAGFAVGFGFRPLGAVLFGFLGDKLGRKYTFLVTITMMGIATAGVGFIPSYASIGFAAPVLVIGLRILQGLALGGNMAGRRFMSRSIRHLANPAFTPASSRPAWRAGLFSALSSCCSPRDCCLPMCGMIGGGASRSSSRSSC